MPKSYGKAVPFNTHAERFEPQKPASSTDEIVEASTPDYDAINRITGAFSKVHPLLSRDSTQIWIQIVDKVGAGVDVAAVAE